MMPTTDETQLAVQPIQRIEQNCSWWELSFAESDDDSDCSSTFAQHSISSIFGDDSFSSIEGRQDMLSYFKSGNSSSKDITAPIALVCNKEKPSSRGNLLSKQRSWRTGRYIGFKEQANRTEVSDARRGLVRSALYACMDEEDEDFLKA